MKDSLHEFYGDDSVLTEIKVPKYEFPFGGRARSVEGGVLIYAPGVQLVDVCVRVDEPKETHGK